jgi:hypothetical protein
LHGNNVFLILALTGIKGNAMVMRLTKWQQTGSNDFFPKLKFRIGKFLLLQGLLALKP